LAQAWDRMLKNNIKALPVVDANNVVIGMLTDEDILTRASLGQRLAVAERLDAAVLQQELQRLESSSLRVAEVMSKPPITTTPKESLAVAAARMANAGIKRLPVVDESGKIVGVIARLEILEQVADAQTKVGKKPIPVGAGQIVSDVMQPEIPLVQYNADLAELVNAFVTANTHRLIVVDEQGRPEGLISDADVVSRVQPTHQRGMLDALMRKGSVPASSVIARELMSPEVLSVTPNTALTDAIQKMLAAGRKWMIVVDDQGKPLGLLDRQALLVAVTGSAGTSEV